MPDKEEMFILGMRRNLKLTKDTAAKELRTLKTENSVLRKRNAELFHTISGLEITIEELKELLKP